MNTAEVISIEPPCTPVGLFRALADDTRLRALLLMASEGELCVCEFTYVLEASQPKVSRHLAILRKAGLVTDRRDRTWIYYRLAESIPVWARETLDAVTHGNATALPFSNDRARLAKMPGRPGGCC